MKPSQNKKFDHDLCARSKDETDFWGQIRRTVNGKPVDDNQISLITERIREKLALQEKDVVLDLACGNGALSSRIFKQFSSYLGVDSSPRLIEVANKYFANPPRYLFTNCDASEHTRTDDNPRRYTKVLCYGSFPYFQHKRALQILHNLSQRYSNVTKVFIGNLPDLSLANKFYGEGNINPLELVDNESPIGIWRTREEFIEVAQNTGWRATISTMPENYYAAYYRYDVLLSR